MRYFLIDRVTEWVRGERARGVKNVTLSDEVLHDHFPDYPLMPGALMLEAIAQLGGFLIETSSDDAGPMPRRAILAQIDRAKFSRPAGPGDQLDVRVAFGPALSNAVQIAGEIFVGGDRIVRANITFMLQAVDSPRVHEQRRYLYGLWTRTLEPRPPIL